MDNNRTIRIQPPDGKDEFYRLDDGTWIDAQGCDATDVIRADLELKRITVLTPPVPESKLLRYCQETIAGLREEIHRLSACAYHDHRAWDAYRYRVGRFHADTHRIIGHCIEALGDDQAELREMLRARLTVQI